MLEQDGSRRANYLPLPSAVRRLSQQGNWNCWSAAAARRAAKGSRGRSGPAETIEDGAPTSVLCHHGDDWLTLGAMIRTLVNKYFLPRVEGRTASSLPIGARSPLLGSRWSFSWLDLIGQPAGRPAETGSRSRSRCCLFFLRHFAGLLWEVEDGAVKTINTLGT